MTCPEARVLAYLAGEMSGQAERDFDEHLLGCESCWHEVQADRAARRALEQLHGPLPAGLHDRIELAIKVASHDARATPRLGARRGRRTRPSSPSRRRTRLIAAAATAAAAAALAASLYAVHGVASDPPQIAAVAAMVTPHRAPPEALMSGETRTIGGQRLVIRAYVIDGTEAITASASSPIPMPVASHLLAGSSPRAWMATRGSLSMYGVNRPGGQPSMFLVAAVPMAELPELAADLHLI